MLAQLSGYRDRLRVISQMEHPVDQRVRAAQAVSFVLGLLGVFEDGEVGGLLTEIDQLFNQCLFGDAPLPRPDEVHEAALLHPEVPPKTKRGRRRRTVDEA